MSENADAVWPYFVLNFPGLSRDDAGRSLELVRQQGPALRSLLSGEGMSPGSIIEPDLFYARYLDKCTVQTLRKASEIALAADALADHEVDVLSSMVEDFTEWLEQAALEDDDCADV